jgi:hypothetical protein
MARVELDNTHRVPNEWAPRCRAIAHMRLSKNPKLIVVMLAFFGNVLARGVRRDTMCEHIRAIDARAAIETLVITPEGEQP